jgi:hypothetical protein
MGQIFAHVNRDKNQTRKYGNADIDPRKTYRNYDLQHGDIDALQKRLEEVSHTKRHDLVACCGVVVTLPRELEKEHVQSQNEFFEDVKKFLDEKFGKQNCIYATVHMDESTPHLHYGFVPTVVKQRKYRSAEKKGQTYSQERVCAKEVVTKDMLSKLHDELQERICATPYFRKVRVVAPTKSKRLNHSLSISELKAKTAEKLEKEVATQQLLTAKAEQNANEAILAHKKAQKTLEDSASLSQHLQRLSERKFERKKGHLGRVLVTESEYNELVDKAESVENLAKEREFLLRTMSGQEARRLREENEEIRNYHATDNLRYTRQVEKNTELQRKNTEVQREVVNLTTENEQLKKANEKLKAENLELVGQVETLKKVVKSVWTHLSDYYRELCESLGIRQSRGYHR